MAERNKEDLVEQRLWSHQIELNLDFHQLNLCESLGPYSKFSMKSLMKQ